jgi:5-methylcytosine-specific restriction protein A
MPYAPKRPCTWPGCSELTDGGRCAQHRQQGRREYDTTRREDPIRNFYNSRAWRRASKDNLIQEPLCYECMKHGRLTAAVMTDHIVPIKAGSDPWDAMNWQSLCHSCHSRKSAEEGSRWG